MEDKNNYQIGFADEFNFGETIIKYEVSDDKMLHLYVEDCARALGVTQYKELKDGKLSETVRWEEVSKHLIKIEKIPTDWDLSKIKGKDKSVIRKKIKQMTITESQLYLWSFIVENEKGKQFRDWLAKIVLPNLREYGIYINGMENMTPEEIKVEADKRVEKYILRKWGIGIRKSVTDAIKATINPPKNNYIYAQYTNLVYLILFDRTAREYREELGLSVNDNLRDNLNADEVDLVGKAEDFMCNLLYSGITDYNILGDMLTTWYENIKK